MILAFFNLLIQPINQLFFPEHQSNGPTTQREIQSDSAGFKFNFEFLLLNVLCQATELEK